MRSCPNCGYHEPADDLRFCARCGTELPGGEVFSTRPSPVKKHKVLIMVIIALAVIAAITVAAIIVVIMSVGSGGSESKPIATVTTTASGDAATVEDENALKEPFNLKIASLEGSLPADLTEMKDMLGQITITVNNGVASGSVSQPAVSGDGTIMPGQNKTLEIKGTYDGGVLMVTWEYFRPYGVANVNGGGYIDSRGLLTKENVNCSLNGTFNRATSDGQVETHTLDEITIKFAVAG